MSDKKVRTYIFPDWDEDNEEDREAIKKLREKSKYYRKRMPKQKVKNVEAISEKMRTGHNMPDIEFEGPLGDFWPLNEVPIEAITRGMAKLYMECLKRGYKEDFIIEMVKLKVKQ